MKRLPLWLIVGFLVAFTSCAHHRDVRPGADGVNHVVVRAADKEKAERGAISQAENFCKESNKVPGFVGDGSTTYTGQMDEKTRATIKTASKVAVIAGHSAAGAEPGLRTAGQVGSAMTNGDDYVADMRFKCQ